MGQLRIEFCGIPTYCMNIEECMSVEVEANKSHGAMISRTVNTCPVQQTVKGSLSDAWPANFS